MDSQNDVQPVATYFTNHLEAPNDGSHELSIFNLSLVLIPTWLTLLTLPNNIANQPLLTSLYSWGIWVYFVLVH